ncbi:MAG: pilus assembly protein PilX [Gammaproteobacteria bacterium]|nr:pilus assembly protein PilX [Gammaproteobacteria bacterium]MDE2349126.1 pilus assembly protein PilX [Gammaproteobacteria bacterium]
MNEPRHAHSQRGMVLITSLLLLIVVTILALGMFRSFGLDEKIAGNVRDKALALHAAESAEQYAEWWLQSGTAPSATNCTAVVASNPGQVCTNALSNPTVLPWAAGVTYTPNALGLSNPSTQAQQAPMFYIRDLGTPSFSTGLTGELYQIDAVGFGGSANTTAVVESTYLVQSGSGTQSAGGP